MEKLKIKMNKPIYLDLSRLETSKTLMYEFSYDYIKPMYQNNARLCYTDTNSFIINFKTKDFYEGILNDVKKDLIQQIIKSIDHYLKERIKK